MTSYGPRRALRLGTRTTELARKQALIAARSIRARHGDLPISIHYLGSSGDARLGVPFAALPDDAFTDTLDVALAEGSIDLAVHSAKDVPLTRAIDAYLLRADARDVLVSHRGPLDMLPAGARIGTCSRARARQLLAARPDLRACDIRGDVAARLRQLDEGRYDAIVLAAAGLKRLALEVRITEYLPLETFVPAAGQGALALISRERAATAIAHSVSHTDTWLCVEAERAFARNAACKTIAAAAHAAVTESRIRLVAFAGTSCGCVVRRTGEGELSRAVAIAEGLASEVRQLVSDMVSIP